MPPLKSSIGLGNSRTMSNTERGLARRDADGLRRHEVLLDATDTTGHACAAGALASPPKLSRLDEGDSPCQGWSSLTR